MPTFVVLTSFTQKGVENIKANPAWLDAFKQAAQRMGVEVKAFYLTMGRFDLVVVVEAPNEATVAKLLLATAALGNLHTETLRAFTEDEYRKIIAELP